MSKKDPRDMIGYGSKDQKIKWPNNARIAAVSYTHLTLPTE